MDVTEMFLWGQDDEGYWHRLMRHDPDYASGKDGPGTGRTDCGIENLQLVAIGEDPSESDQLCPACKRKSQS